MPGRDAWGSGRGLLRTSASVVLALLAALVVPVTAVVPTLTPTAAAATSFDVGAPSWWVGDCDATRWGPIAASMGWTGVGSHRLGASYLGVPVCGPRPAVDGSPDVRWGRAGWGEAEWECVELAQRFMALVYGTQAYGANGADVVNNYQPKYGGNLVKITNGTVGRAPVPGDIVSFTTPRNRFGHVTVITSSTVDGNGNGTVTMLSQNDTSNGWRTLPVVNWVLQGFGTMTPYGWLHDPAGRGNPLGDGTFVRVYGQSTTYRIVGGAPVVVSSWASFGTPPQPVTSIDAAQLARLRAYPADGTYLSDSSTGQVYRMAGGAPLAVSATDAAAMPGAGAAPVWTVDHWAIVNNDHLRPYPADRTEICRVDDGSCYLVAGGAPMRVPASEIPLTPGWSPSTATVVSGAEFTAYVHLRPSPADGTFLCDVTTTACYSTAGGAPLLLPALDAPRVPGWSPAAVIRLAHWEFGHYEHLARYVADGSVLCPVTAPQCYVVAGHAPLPFTAAVTSVPALSLTGAVRVSAYEIAHPVHLTARPVDGTVLQAAQGGPAFVVRGGVARALAPVTSTATTTGSPAPGTSTATTTTAAPVGVLVDRAAIDNAGTGGVWGHLLSAPVAVQLTAPTQSVTLWPSITLTWDAPVASSAVLSYAVRVRTATPNRGFGPWTLAVGGAALTRTRFTASLLPGQTACYSVRATNRAHQVGPWSAPRCVARILDDSTGTVSGRWHTERSSLLYRGSAWTSARHGSRWTLPRVSAVQVGILATMCPTCGSATVYVGTRRVGSISLASPTLAYRRLLMLPRFPATSGTLMVVVGSRDWATVQLDGVVVSRA